MCEFEDDAEAPPSFGDFGVERGGLLEVTCLLGEERSRGLQGMVVTGRDRLDAVENPFRERPLTRRERGPDEFRYSRDVVRVVG